MDTARPQSIEKVRVSETQPAAHSSARPVDPVVARKAFGRFRVMAFVTGGMLLLLSLEVVLKYGFRLGGVTDAGTPLPVLGDWIAFAHGWIYVIYLVTVVDLWTRMRWSPNRVVVLVLAGVVPVLSFVVEPRAGRWLRQSLTAAGT